MKKAIWVFFAILLVVGLVRADVDTKDGVAITTSTTLDGQTGIDTVDGQTITSGVSYLFHETWNEATEDETWTELPGT